MASKWKLQEWLAGRGHCFLSKLLTAAALTSFSLVFTRNSLCRVNSGSYSDFGIPLGIGPSLALSIPIYC